MKVSLAASGILLTLRRLHSCYIYTISDRVTALSGCVGGAPKLAFVAPETIGFDQANPCPLGNIVVPAIVNCAA